MQNDFDKAMSQGINAEAHEQEIISSRTGGFGGSDAKLFLNIAHKGVRRLSKGDNERIAQAMGLAAYKGGMQNVYTVAGHKFEDEVDKSLSSFLSDLEREKLLEAPIAKNFRTFAHADFVRKDGKVVYECKFYAKKSTDETEAEVMPQLQWYYMLGAEQVYLVHGVGDAEVFRVDNIITRPIARNEETIAMLRKGIEALDKAIAEGWQPDLKQSVDVPEELKPIFDAYFEAAAEVERIELDLAPIKAQMDRYKEQIAEYMTGKELNAISRTDRRGISHTATITTKSGARTFDSKKFLAAHPEHNLAEWYKTGKDSTIITLK